MNHVMQLEAMVGFFWVIEWTEDHHYHAHVVFWLDGSKTQNTYPWAQQVGLYWCDITDRDGWYHRCEFKEHYEANINIPVRYSDPDSITNIRQVLAYMTKIQQKRGCRCLVATKFHPPTDRSATTQSLRVFTSQRLSVTTKNSNDSPHGLTSLPLITLN